MTNPYLANPYMIAQQIEESENRLDELMAEARSAAIGAANDEATFKAEFAKARLRARVAKQESGEKYTTDTIEDIATVETADLRQAFLISTHRLTVAREALRAEESKLDGRRTRSASVRLAGG